MEILSNLQKVAQYYCCSSEITEGAGGFNPLKESKITPPLGPGICRPSCNGLHPESETNSKLTVCREWRDCT